MGQSQTIKRSLAIILTNLRDRQQHWRKHKAEPFKTHDFLPVVSHIVVSENQVKTVIEKLLNAIRLKKVGCDNVSRAMLIALQVKISKIIQNSETVVYIG